MRSHRPCRRGCAATASVTATRMPISPLTHRQSIPVRSRCLTRRNPPARRVGDFRCLRGGRRRAQENLALNMHGSELLLPTERTFAANSPSNTDPIRARAQTFLCLACLADRLVAWCVCRRSSSSRSSRTVCPSSRASVRGWVRCVSALEPSPTGPWIVVDSRAAFRLLPHTATRATLSS